MAGHEGHDTPPSHQPPEAGPSTGIHIYYQPIGLSFADSYNKRNTQPPLGGQGEYSMT